MSFALTERQLLDGSKTVTRRVGWRNLKPGDRLLAVRKAMGLKPGEKVQPLCEIEVVSVRRERLDAITPADVLAEGFPQWTNQVGEFVRMFCEHHSVSDGQRLTSSGAWTNAHRKMRPDDEVTRIEFRKVPGSERVAVQQPLIAC
ncbi:MAG TPA: ASCH domain-containing protein [Nannocystis sp.]